MFARLLPLAFLLSGMAAQARSLYPVTPETLWPKAEVIVIGQVEDIQMTRETRELRAEGRPVAPVRVAHATVRTLGMNKGDLTFRFAFHFVTIDTDRPLTDGPVLVEMQPGGRYRFYLKKQGTYYVGALEGEYDHGYAVQPMAVNESSRSLPLLHRDALPMARAEFQRHRPRQTIYTVTSNYRPKIGWTYYFYSRSPVQYPAFAAEAGITINGARRVAARSWVGLETPRPGAQLTEEDVGPRLRVTMDGDVRNNAFYASEGIVTVLLGQIEKMEEESVTGTFTTNMSTEVRTLTIPRKSLLSVQRILPADRIGSP